MLYFIVLSKVNPMSKNTIVIVILKSIIVKDIKFFWILLNPYKKTLFLKGFKVISFNIHNVINKNIPINSNMKHPPAKADNLPTYKE